jgi:ribosome maturation factor RimP
MHTNKDIRAKLWGIVAPVVEGKGLDLLEIEYLRERHWVLRVYVDRRDIEIVPGLGVAPGFGINLDDCVEISRELSAVLDLENFISHTYHLEVSSAGVQRPLRKLSDFQKFCGCRVRVRTDIPICTIEPPGINPSRNFLGLLEHADNEEIELCVDKQRYRIVLSQILQARLEPDMDQWMSLAVKKRKEQQGS